jgi:hypothetical protein
VDPNPPWTLQRRINVCPCRESNSNSKSPVCIDITLYSPLKVNRHFGGTCRLHLQGRKTGQRTDQHEADSKQSFTLVSCLAYYSTLKMNETCSYEMLVDFQRTIRRCIPEDRTLQGHRCENLKFCKFQIRYRPVSFYDFMVYLTKLSVGPGSRELETARANYNEMASHSFSFMESG